MTTENILTVGSLAKDRFGTYYLRPLRKLEMKLPPRIQLESAPSNLVVGMYVVARLKSTHGVVYAYYQKTLGFVDDPGVEIEIAAIQYGLTLRWPKGLQEATLKLADKPIQAAGRIDLRASPFFTIDDEDARDHDDALYCEPRKEGGWRLWVAIADVSWYVQPDDPLDQAASERGCSVYFPDSVVSMLPELLANDLCSLKPKVDRLCLVCEMTIDQQGQLVDYRFYEAIINSAAKLNYSAVNRLLAQKGMGLVAATKKPQPEVDRAHQQMAPHLENLYTLYLALREAREERGGIDVNLPSSKIVFDQGKMVGVDQEERGVANRMVEECMIKANLAAASLCSQQNIPCLYRVHEPPTEIDHFQLANFFRRMKIKLPLDRRLPMDYYRAVQQIEGRPDGEILSLQMLRAMTRAFYQTKNIGHFGLALTSYAHFTSPIRRYPDLLLHRAIKSAIKGGVASSDQAGRKDSGRKPSSANKPAQQLNHIGMALSDASRRAEQASKFVEDWHICLFMQHHMGKTFASTVMDIREFGLFVKLKDFHIQGMVHISTLGQDYFEYDPKRMRLVGRKSRKVFSLGDTFSVRLTEIDQDKVRLAFAPSNASGRGKRHSQHKKNFKRKKFKRSDRW